MASYRTDYARAHGWGSAHAGVHHFWVQRMTAVALVPLAILFVLPFARALGSDYEAARAIYQNGWNVFIAINFIIIAMWPLKLGLQVIIEDYVHSKTHRLRLMVTNLLFCWSFAVAGVYAVARIAFSA